MKRTPSLSLLLVLSLSLYPHQIHTIDWDDTCNRILVNVASAIIGGALTTGTQVILRPYISPQEKNPLQETQIELQKQQLLLSLIKETRKDLLLIKEKRDEVCKDAQNKDCAIYQELYEKTRQALINQCNDRI